VVGRCGVLSRGRQDRRGERNVAAELLRKVGRQARDLLVLVDDEGGRDRHLCGVCVCVCACVCVCGVCV